MAEPTVRVELDVTHLTSYLVGVLGPGGVTMAVLEAEPAKLRTLLQDGLEQVDAAEGHGPRHLAGP